MKKKIIAMLLVVCMACSVTACGGSEKKVSVVTIGGEEYDLTGAFQDVVGAMVKNGTKVASVSGKWNLYGEDGNFVSGSSALEEGYDIAAGEWDQTDGFATEKKEQLLVERGYFIRTDFYLDDMEENGIVSDLGISSVKSVEKNIDEEMFLEIEGGNSAYINGIRGYVGVFVNGEALDFSDYEDELEELKSYTVTGYNRLIDERFPNMSAIGIGILNGDIFRMAQTYDELSEIMDKLSVSLENELLVWFALEDAYEQLEAGNAENFIFVSFGISEEQETVNMMYSEFYFDKTRSTAESEMDEK